MKYLKTYEIYEQDDKMVKKFIPDLGNDQIMTINNIINYLDVDVQYPEDSVVIPVSRYNIDVIEYFKEIFLNKIVSFKSVDALARPEKNPKIKGLVIDVNQLAYQDEFYIRVKIKDKFKNLGYPKEFEDGWFLINNEYDVWVYNYDADTKPLHEEVELKRVALKYNI
jgi:hypothetical protein